ncbi:hypothetical protein [Bradyrhizobium sp. Leo170]|uniref:hypothetical protein n=1 Tax=Bradyrhizobium sp. Leo170 TaxID=1571199 RepID=UPI00102E2611|nr:hypothetical protein [Bradyrhizobium sp. Leo170]TAI67636.1 hypothetical protein CWO89_02125 [Bradyrhizobium sp. Leo170]
MTEEINRMKFPWQKSIVREFIPTAIGEKLDKGACLLVEGPEFSKMRNFVIADENGVVIWTGDTEAFTKLIRDAARSAAAA